MRACVCTYVYGVCVAVGAEYVQGAGIYYYREHILKRTHSKENTFYRTHYCVAVGAEYVQGVCTCKVSLHISCPIAREHIL